MKAGTLLLRADASVEMGTGHLMRCLALAEYWRDQDGQALLATHCHLDPLLDGFRAEGVEVLKQRNGAASNQEADEISIHAKKIGANWIALDGYQFSAEYHERLSGAGAHVLLIDDNGHAGRYSADLVLDQNLTAEENNYRKRSEKTRLLLGTKYVLLRREFRAAKQRGSRQGERTRAFVSMGGSDPENVMAKVLRAISGCEHLEVRAVIGAGNRFLTAVQRIAGQSRASMQLEIKANMSELMAWADVAISAAGATLWELAFMGVPTLTVELVDHQRPISRAFAEHGAGMNLGWHADLHDAKIVSELQAISSDCARREAMSARGRSMVDGRGPERVFAAMTDFE